VFSREPRVYLSYHGIVAPSGPEISLNLLLARARPRRVMALRYSNARRAA
jgi:hypothetical protein